VVWRGEELVEIREDAAGELDAATGEVGEGVENLLLAELLSHPAKPGHGCLIPRIGRVNLAP
jgi:hypothetical protein